MALVNTEMKLLHARTDLKAKYRQLNLKGFYDVRL